MKNKRIYEFAYTSSRIWPATQAQNKKYDLYKEGKPQTRITYLTNNEGNKTRHYSIHIHLRQ
jgi:hypothetical protein